MAKNSSMPSLAALLGLVAVAGYQNRDKIGDFVKNMTGGLAQAGGGAAPAQLPQGGLGDLVDSFRKAGLGDKADSWVSTGANKPVSAPEMEKGLGGDLLGQLAQQTGLSREDLLKRLTTVLPDVVDKMTPTGRL